MAPKRKADDDEARELESEKEQESAQASAPPKQRPNWSRQTTAGGGRGEFAEAPRAEPSLVDASAGSSCAPAEEGSPPEECTGLSVVTEGTLPAVGVVSGVLHLDGRFTYGKLAGRMRAQLEVLTLANGTASFRVQFTRDGTREPPTVLYLPKPWWWFLRALPARDGAPPMLLIADVDQTATYLPRLRSASELKEALRQKGREMQAALERVINAAAVKEEEAARRAVEDYERQLLESG